MIRANATKHELEMGGNVGELLSEICSAIKVLAEQSELAEAGAGEYIKAIIVDQIQSNFDATRVGLYKESDFIKSEAESDEVKVC